MSRSWCCDRCGAHMRRQVEVFEVKTEWQEPSKAGAAGGETTRFKKRDYDLCLDCRTAFERWLAAPAVVRVDVAVVNPEREETSHVA